MYNKPKEIKTKINNFYNYKLYNIFINRKKIIKTTKIQLDVYSSGER